MSEEKRGISNAQVTALISVKWKVHSTTPTFLTISFSDTYSTPDLLVKILIYVQELSEEEKQKWNGEAVEAMEAYKKELEEYNKNVTEIPNNDN